MNIDFVITWVDGSDPQWLKEKNQYMQKNEKEGGESRYRDMETLKYWFRAVEAYAPWVNKIHFVTWGHLPEWLDTDNPKLHIVNHKDYIPEKYLPTFSSHPIELNMHRIPELSEHFVYFNDDMFLNGPVTPEFFFKNGLPCDFAHIINIWLESSDDGYGHILFTEVHEISRFFSYIKSFFKNIGRYVNFAYPLKANVCNILKLENKNLFVGFDDHHLASPFLKSTFEEVWEKDGEVLDKICYNRFRTPYDVSQRIFRYWQLASGKFSVVSKKSRGKYLNLSDDLLGKLQEILADEDCKMLCINDSDYADFDYCKSIVVKSFEKKFPEKSTFEKGK